MVRPASTPVMSTRRATPPRGGPAAVGRRRSALESATLCLGSDEPVSEDQEMPEIGARGGVREEPAGHVEIDDVGHEGSAGPGPEDVLVAKAGERAPDHLVHEPAWSIELGDSRGHAPGQAEV